MLLSILATAAAAQLVLPGFFHAGEAEARDGEVWWGLYETSDGFQLEPTRLEVTPVFDPLMDEDWEATGMEILAEGERQPLFLVKDVPLQAGPVRTATADVTPLVPGSVVGLTEELLVVYGTAREPAMPGLPPALEDVRVVLQGLPGGAPSQELLTLDAPDLAAPSLVWAGDLDGDGEVDLLLDATDHYAASAYTLLLSSAAAPGQRVAEVATLVLSSC